MPLVTLRSYRDPIEADIARSLLEDAGIPTIVVDDHLITAQWLYSDAIGGVKLRLDAADVVQASAILGEDRSADLERIAEFSNPPADGESCPECGSLDTAPSVSRRNLAALSLFLGFPLTGGRRRWRCESCRHAWQRRPSRPTRASAHTVAAEQEVHERSRHPMARGFLLLLLGVIVLSYVARAIHPHTPPL